MEIYKLLCIDGIIGMILSILLKVITQPSIVCNNLKGIFNEDIVTLYCNSNDLKSTIENFFFKSPQSFIISFVLILVNFCETWSIWLLIFNFSVNNFAAFNSISLFVNFILSIYKKDALVYIECILGILIITFSLLVYNEIIILKFYDFDKNTIIEINKRSTIDSSCDFGEDDDEICTKSNDNYLIMKEDFEGINDETNEAF